jgi:hypothetical protein
MSTDPFDERPGSGRKTLSFTNTDEVTGVKTPKPVGTTLGGKTLGPATSIQAYDFDSKKPLWWPAGQGKPTTQEPENMGSMSAAEIEKRKVLDFVVPILTDDGEETQFRARMTTGGKDPKVVTMYAAIKAARAKAGSAIAAGGDLRVTLAEIKPNPNGGQPQKGYSAVYTVPDAFAAEPVANGSQPAAVPPPPPAVPAPPASVPAPPAEPTTPEGYTMSSLLAGGWTREQVLASYPALGVAAVPAAPPAPPAAPAATQDPQAVLAAMSDTDLDMIGYYRAPDGRVLQKA